MHKIYLDFLIQEPWLLSAPILTEAAVLKCSYFTLPDTLNDYPTFCTIFRMTDSNIAGVISQSYLYHLHEGLCLVNIYISLLDVHQH